jgi:acyl-CoA synthetase (AMP-forming)/AMP-acid ligase II
LPFTPKAFGQFYNGHQMSFGKNRVQFNEFYWQYIRYPKFDVYFYVNGRELANFVADVANTELEMMEYSVEEFLQQRIIFIVYNKQSEFRQSNIGLVSGNDEYNIGGVTRIIDNKVFVYNEGDHQKLRRQIKASLAEVLINEMMYGGNLRDRVSSSATINLPDWYVKGLISFLSGDDDYQVEAKIKEAILNEKCHKIHRMQGDDARIAGHAFWRYLSETYGSQIIPQIIYMTRISKNLESGFLYVLGRFKSLLISNDGEKFSPESIEEAICEHSKLIDQIILYNNQSPYTVALVVPNFDALKQYASKHNINNKDDESCKKLIKAIDDEISKFKIGGEFGNQFPQRWLPASFAVLGEAFSEQNKFLNSRSEEHT